MDVRWKRFHLLIFFLTFWKHAVGRESLDLQSVHPRSLHFLKTSSPPEVQSSMLNASVIRNIPHEEVDSNVLGGNGTGPSRSLFSYLQFVKGGAPSGYASLSQAQSASSGSVSTSLTAPQNLSQPGSYSTLFHVQGSSTSNVMAGQSVSGTGYHQYDSTSKDSTGLNTGGSIQLVSSTGGSGLSQSSFSQYAPGFSPLSYSPTVLSQSGSKSPSSQSSSGPLMGGISSRLFTLTSQGSSRPQVTQGGSTSLSGLYQQSPSKSQSSPTYSRPGSLPLAVSRYPTGSQSLFSSGSQGSSSYQLAASRPSGLAQGSSSQPGVSYVQSQGRLSQVAIGSPQYGSVSLASPQVPQKWLPSASSFSPGSQTSGTVVSQSSYSSQSAPAPSKPLSSVGLPSAPQVPQKWLSSASSFSPGSQTSGTVVSQSSYSSQSAPAPSKPLSSVGLPSAPQVPQKWLPSASSFSPGSQTSGTVVSQSRYSPQSVPAPSKPLSVGLPSASLAAPQAPQKWLSSASSFSPGSQTSGTVVSQSRYSPQSVPAPSKPLSVGLPSASLAAPQAPQKWLPSAYSFSPSSQTSGTVVSQSSYSPQSAPAPSKPLSSVGLPSAPQVPQKWLSSASSFSPGSQTSGTVVSQSSYSSQSAPAPSKPLSSVGLPSAPQVPQKWLPSASSFSPGSQTSGTVVSQSRYSPQSVPAPSKPLSVGLPSASLAAPQAPQKWLPSAYSFSPSSQTSGTVVSQSSYSPQSAPAPSKPLSSVGLPSAPQVPQKWLSSASSFSPGSQTSGTVVSQSRYSPQSAPAPSKPLSSVGLPGQVAPGLLYSSASLAAPQVPQKWLPSASFSPGSQTSGTVVSQSSYSPQSAPAPTRPLSSVGLPSQVASSLLSSASIASPQNVLCPYDKAAKTPISFSPSSAGGPSPLVSTQGVGSYSGSSYVPGSSTYPKLVSSPLGAPSQFTSAQSSRDPSTLSLQSGVGTAQTVSSHYVLPQKGSLSTFSSSLQSQVASRPSGPAPSLDAKVPVYSQTPPAGTMYQSQPYRFWQPSTSKASGSSTSDATVLQSSSSSQSVQASSRFSSAGGASFPVSTQGGGSYSGTVQQYTAVAPASGVFGSSPLSVSSQSASGQSSPSKHSSLSQDQRLLTSSGYLSVPGGSGFSDGSFLTQGTLGKYALVPSMDKRLPGSTAQGVSVSSQAQPLSDPVKYGASVGGQGMPSGSSVLYSRYGSSSQSGPVSTSQVSGSAGSQVSPSLFASLKVPTVSKTPGSTAQGVSVSSQAQPLTDPVKYGAGSQGMPSGLSVLYSRYGSSSQSGPVSSSAGSQVSPSLVASLKQPIGSMTPGSTAQGVSVSSQAQPLTDPVKYGAGSQGMPSGLSVLYSRYGSSSQSGPVSSSPVSGSAGSQMSPSLFASLQQPIGSMTPGSTAQGVSVSSQAQPLTDPVKYGASVGGQGMPSGLSSVLYSRYGSSSQSGPVSSSPVSGSAGSQMSPSLFASLQQPIGSMTPGSTAQGVSVSSQAQPLTDPVKYGASVGGQGMPSGLSSVLYSRYGFSSQSGPVSSSPVSGSAGSQMSPSLVASLKQPIGSMTPGSTAQGVSVSSQAQPLTDPVKYGASVGGQGMPSGLSSVLYSRYSSSSQSGPVSGSAGSQVSPSLVASLKQPIGSMTPGSTAQGVSVSSQAQPLTDPVKYGASVGGQGMPSGLSSVLYSRYGFSSQSGPVSSSPVSGSAGSQVSPSLVASLKQPIGSMTPGSTAQGVSVSSQAQPLTDPVKYGASVGGQGMPSGLSSVLYSRYSSSSQSGPVSSSPVSGSAGSQMSPSLVASLKQPIGSMTPGSTAQGVSVSSQAQPLTDPVKYGASVGGQGMPSGLSSVLYSRYSSSSQSGPVSGSAGSQVSPSLFASRGSTAQTASGGMSSAPPQALGDTYGASVGGQGMSSGSVSSGFTSVSSSYGSSYGQNYPLPKPSQGSFSQYYAVKG
ncbi:uncharacterized protein [Paramisgurnus dabryanus]|uniref:uncharacterized protein isoform X2 n=1 Tax=Paramisgurnus dabryanus TaxID=90735 RepID=UPI003CCF1443